MYTSQPIRALSLSHTPLSPSGLFPVHLLACHGFLSPLSLHGHFSLYPPHFFTQLTVTSQLSGTFFFPLVLLPSHRHHFSHSQEDHFSAIRCTLSLTQLLSSPLGLSFPSSIRHFPAQSDSLTHPSPPAHQDFPPFFKPLSLSELPVISPTGLHGHFRRHRFASNSHRGRFC